MFGWRVSCAALIVRVHYFFSRVAVIVVFTDSYRLLAVDFALFASFGTFIMLEMFVHLHITQLNRMYFFGKANATMCLRVCIFFNNNTE